MCVSTKRMERNARQLRTISVPMYENTDVRTVRCNVPRVLARVFVRSAVLVHKLDLLIRAYVARMDCVFMDHGICVYGTRLTCKSVLNRPTARRLQYNVILNVASLHWIRNIARANLLTNICKLPGLHGLRTYLCRRAKTKM